MASSRAARARWTVWGLGRMRGLSLGRIDVARGDVAVSVDATIAVKRPISAHVLLSAQVNLDHQRLLGFTRLGQHDAEGIGHEAVAPELDAAVLRPFVP